MQISILENAEIKEKTIYSGRVNLIGILMHYLYFKIACSRQIFSGFLRSLLIQLRV